MGNIHAGEVEGKEAALNLARRLLFGDLKPLLSKLTILIAPIYNADGNEKISTDNRTNQNGPIGGVGARENAEARLEPRLYEARFARGARLGRCLQPLGSASDGRSAHHERVVSRLSPDVFAAAQPEYRSGDPRFPAPPDDACDRGFTAEEFQVSFLLLRQFHGIFEYA
ncbi:MAG: hypothetical protein IPJ30_19795 [Acidobacteria bacterium]|nr:hypothetical protein [Acidobacteriota bacterium]